MKALSIIGIIGTVVVVFLLATGIGLTDFTIFVGAGLLLSLFALPKKMLRIWPDINWKVALGIIQAALSITLFILLNQYSPFNPNHTDFVFFKPVFLLFAMITAISGFMGIVNILSGLFEHHKMLIH